MKAIDRVVILLYARQSQNHARCAAVAQTKWSDTPEAIASQCGCENAVRRQYDPFAPAVLVEIALDLGFINQISLLCRLPASLKIAPG